MISLKKVIRNARRWQKIAAVRIKRISYSRITGKMEVDDNTPSFVAEKGHYKRFAIPLAYLGNKIFLELFKMSEEEFGVSSDRPITLPCDSEYMNYILSLIKRGEAKDFEKVLTNSITTR
ncbi:hypothetical protein POTOM_016109 [Populus tomentosa]|uniref:SAUR-like auxin-responsive protein family n=1 Tax=Populus tomentosa TaxID=118781 RepID=A0A8X8A115_POPTO|nr:hypothetical protein POTOM_016109 [Populus tomentosa]